MHHAIGIGLLIYLVVFLFGAPAARAIIGSAFAVAVLTFLYIMYRVVTGSI